MKLSEKLQVFLQISEEFLSGSWQYWSNLRALPTMSSFCLFVFIGGGSSGYENLF